MTSCGSDRPLRILLVGAFVYPHHQGSQIYFQEQAIALRSAGAQVDLLTYGPGRRRGPRSTSSPESTDDLGGRPDPDRWRALDGFHHVTIPRWAAPGSSRSGPRLDKPLADLALASAIHRRIGCAFEAEQDRGPSRSMTRTSKGASSRIAAALARSRDPGMPEPYDAILAHHVEATGAALLACSGRPHRRPPVVYCAHTVLEEELPTYWKPAMRRWLASSGRIIDRALARHADGWIALTERSERVMRASSERPGRRIPPPVPDPLPGMSAGSLPGEAEALVRRLGLRPGGFFLYAGNLDPYQDLPLLLEGARRRNAMRDRRPIGSGAGDPTAAGRLPIVIASHAGNADGSGAGEGRSGLAGLALARDHEVGAREGAGDGIRFAPVRRLAEMRALIAAARATLIPRQGLGGFPIKLANSLAAGTPVVAFHAAEWGLVDGRDSLICGRDDPAGSLACALARLEHDAALAIRLGRGARETWQRQHAPGVAAAATLALIESLRR